MKTLLLVGVFCSCAFAQSSMTVKAGALQCGAMRISSTRVQAYCNTGPVNGVWTLIYNSILNAAGLTMPVTLQANCSYAASGSTTTDSVAWIFTVTATTMKYTISINGGALKTGILQ